MLLMYKYCERTIVSMLRALRVFNLLHVLRFLKQNKGEGVVVQELGIFDDHAKHITQRKLPRTTTQHTAIEWDTYRIRGDALRERVHVTASDGAREVGGRPPRLSAQIVEAQVQNLLGCRVVLTRPVFETQVDGSVDIEAVDVIDERHLEDGLAPRAPIHSGFTRERQT